MVKRLNESNHRVTFNEIVDILESCHDKIDLSEALLLSLLQEPNGENHDFSLLNSYDRSDKKEISKYIREIEVAIDYCSMYLKKN